MRLLEEARRHYPSAPQLTYLLAIALREAKQSQAAVTTFEEALHESEASGQEVVNDRFYFEYGAAAEQAGLYDKAAELFKRSIALDPADAAQAYNYLGFMWADQNTHLDEAEDYIKRALAAEPENGAYLDSLGWLHYRQGKYEQALAELLSASVALKDGDPVVFEHIGDTHAAAEPDAESRRVLAESRSRSIKENKRLAGKIADAKTKLNKGQAAGPTPTK